MKGWTVAIILLAGFLFTVRFLFLITVMAEERTMGGFYEPKRVADIRIEGKNTAIIYQEEFIKKKKIGPFQFLINTYPKDSYPEVKVKSGEREIILLFASYVGALLPIYIPKAYMDVFGKNIYSIRSMLLIAFLLFLYIHIKFAYEYSRKDAIFTSFFLITFPIFGMEFLISSWMSHPVIFILELILIRKIDKILSSSSINSKDAFLITFISGLILHFHLLAGGAILVSMLFAFLMSKKNKIAFKGHSLPFASGFLIFLLLLIPFTVLPISRIWGIPFRGKSSLLDVLITPKNSIFYYLLGIFAPSSFIEFVIHNNFGIRYLPFSIPSGLLLFTSFIGLIMERKKGAFEKFLFISGLLFLLIASFGDIRPYHINYILPFVVLFIPSFLNRLNLSNKWIGGILFIGICYNIIQLEMIRNSVKNSSLSLSLHKEVADYLLKNNIKKIHNIAGRYGYEFISKEEIEVVDFAPFLLFNGISKETLYLSLYSSKNEVILIESLKRGGFTTGISFQEVKRVAGETGLNVEVIRSFPSDENPQLVLARVK